jgi:hypothetical protein
METRGNVRSIEKARKTASISEGSISNTKQYIRLTYICDYLECFSINVIEKNAGQVDADTIKLIQNGPVALRK